MGKNSDFVIKLNNRFEKIYKSDAVITELLRKLDKGTATYNDSWNYANKVGEIAIKAAKEYTVEWLGTEDNYSIVMEYLKDYAYDYTANYSQKCQKIQNKKAKIGVKAQKADFDADRASGIANKVSHAEDEVQFSKAIEKTRDFTENTVGDTIKKNIEFQKKSGLNPKIKRIAAFKCCKWCTEKAGTYDYPCEDEIFRRHENCGCTVDYYGNGLKQNVYTKKIVNIYKPEQIERNVKNSNFLRMNLQLFGGEKGLEKQDDKQLEKGIRSLEKQIEEHEKKIRNARKSNDEELLKCIKHWEREKANFEQSIRNRKDEITRRLK